MLDPTLSYLKIPRTISFYLATPFSLPFSKRTTKVCATIRNVEFVMFLELERQYAGTRTHARVHKLTKSRCGPTWGIPSSTTYAVNRHTNHENLLEAATVCTHTPLRPKVSAIDVTEKTMHERLVLVLGGAQTSGKSTLFPS